MTTPLRRCMARWLTALFVLLSLLLLGSGSAAVAADGDQTEPDPTAGSTESLKFGLGPARDVPKGQVVDGRAYLNYVASPGATVSDEVALLNYGTEPLELQLYATDALQASDGGFSLLPADEKPSDAGSWIALDVGKDQKVTVPPRVGDKYGRLAVPLKISIPADATPGDHVGGVIASLKVTSTNEQGAKVTLDQRIGLRTYFQVSGDLAPGLKIEDLKASYTDQRDPLGRGQISVSYTVHNTGNMRLNATQDVSVNRFLVGSVDGSPAPIEDILPGSRIQVTQTFEHAFGLGPLKAKVTLHPTPVDPQYIQAIPDVTAAKGFWAWPWVLIAIVAGIILLLLLYGGNRRRRRRKRRAALSGPTSAPARELATQGAASNHRTSKPVRGRGRRASHGAPMLVALLLGLSPLVIGVPDAQAKPPDGSLGEVMFETNDATGVPANAILSGWWGHEGGKKKSGDGTTFISMNAADDTGAVTDAALSALHEALGDGGSFDALRVAFVPFSEDGSNERPQVSKGETVADAFTWFADMGMGSPLAGNTNPNDSVATVSTGAEYTKWWDAGRPLEGYTDDLGVIDIADDSSTQRAVAPQGKSILNRWPAGQKISMVLYLSDGTDPTRPGLPTVAVGPDGRAMASWLTFKTVAAPDDPARSSAGYDVLTGAGTGPDAPVPPGGGVQTGGAAPSGGASGSAGSLSDGAGASDGAAGSADGSDAAAPGAGEGTPSADTNVGDEGSDNAVISALPGGTPTFAILLILLVVGGAAWVTWWLRSGRPAGREGSRP